MQSIAADYRDELQGKGLPSGSPAVLVICAAAMSCVHLMKKLPNLNKARCPTAHPPSSGNVADSPPCVAGLGTSTMLELLLVVIILGQFR